MLITKILTIRILLISIRNLLRSINFRNYAIPHGELTS